MTVIVELELRHIDLLAATRPTHLKLTLTFCQIRAAKIEGDH